MTEEQSKFYLLLNSNICQRKLRYISSTLFTTFSYVCFYLSKSLYFARFYIQRVYFLCHGSYAISNILQAEMAELEAPAPVSHRMAAAKMPEQHFHRGTLGTAVL